MCFGIGRAVITVLIFLSSASYYEILEQYYINRALFSLKLYITIYNTIKNSAVDRNHCSHSMEWEITKIRQDLFKKKCSSFAVYFQNYFHPSSQGKKQEFSHHNLLLPLLWMLLLHCSLRAKQGTFLGDSNYISFCTTLYCYSLRTVSCRFALYCLILMYTILYWKAFHHIKIVCIVKYNTGY